MIKPYSKAAFAVFLSLFLAVSAVAGCSSSKPEEAVSTPEPTAVPTAEPDPFAEERDAFDTAASLYYTDRSYAEAYNTLKSFQDTEYAPVRELLGTMLYNGFGTAADRASAIQHLTFAAEKDEALAAYMLGEIYRTDSMAGISADLSNTWYQKALPLLEAAYSDNSTAPEAGRTARAIALIYANGYGTAQDLSKAKAAAESYTNQSGCSVIWAYRIACDMLNFGFGDAQALLTKLFSPIKSAAQLGDTEAMRDIANYYYFGEGGQEQNYAQAMQWLDSAATQNDPVAQNDLAAMYRDGIGTEKNADKAIELYQKAADQGYAFAQYNLATMYIDGSDIAQDLTKAATLLQSAAEQNLIPAQNRLGLLYFEDPMVEKDYKKAAEWFARAASAGNVYAEYNLGRCYLDGLGVEQSKSLALEWLSKAREQKHSGADDLIRSSGLA